MPPLLHSTCLACCRNHTFLPFTFLISTVDAVKPPVGTDNSTYEFTKRVLKDITGERWKSRVSEMIEKEESAAKCFKSESCETFVVFA